MQAQPDDGATTAGGHPDSNHVDNANMATPPDGIAPIMQMYLFHDPADPTDPFLQSNGGDEADVVYHEYTHGLSNRLVVDPSGNSTLGNIQAGSMGEAWSDWYAMDFLNNQGLQRNTDAPGEVRIGEYVGHGLDLIRTQPLDCPVGSTSSRCHGTPGAGPGGYTYGDFGRIIGRPEVHADGEIWGETLWQLRGVLGSKLTESLVTRAMELSPANPSFLDERNAILQADKATARGAHQDAIWKVFAKRGMGYFAGSIDGDDTAPVEDFSLPPAAGTPTGFLTGRVRDIDTAAARGERDRRLRRSRLRLPERLRGHDGAGRQVPDRRDLRRHLPEGLGRRQRLGPPGAGRAVDQLGREHGELGGAPRLGRARRRCVGDRHQRRHGCAVRLWRRGDVQPVAGQRLERVRRLTAPASRCRSSWSWSCRSRST